MDHMWISWLYREKESKAAAEEEEEAVEKVVPVNNNKPKRRTYSVDETRTSSMDTPMEETMVSCPLLFT